MQGRSAKVLKVSGQSTSDETFLENSTGPPPYPFPCRLGLCRPNTKNAVPADGEFGSPCARTPTTDNFWPTRRMRSEDRFIAGQECSSAISTQRHLQGERSSAASCLQRSAAAGSHLRCLWSYGGKFRSSTCGAPRPSIWKLAAGEAGDSKEAFLSCFFR